MQKNHKPKHSQFVFQSCIEHTWPVCSVSLKPSRVFFAVAFFVVLSVFRARELIAVS